MNPDNESDIEAKNDDSSKEVKSPSQETLSESSDVTTTGDDDFEDEEQAAGSEEFQKLLEEEGSLQKFNEGDVVSGKVIQITPSEVIVDIGYKSEGMIDKNEFKDASGAIKIEVGEEIHVLLENKENEEGYVILSKEKAEKMKIWDEVEKAYREKKIVTGIVMERIKGGLVVDIGVRAFLPGSQVDVRPIRNLDSLISQEFKMKVIKVNKKRGNIVLSRKQVLEEEAHEHRLKTLENLQEGKVIKGVVKNITDYGAFIDLGGIDGLLHITDMSWGRVGHPSEFFQEKQEVEIVVLKFDRETEKVSLGYKQKSPDPWENVGEKYHKGDKINGKVVSITDYGAFVELEEGVEGLIHVSEMSWTKRVKHPSKILEEAQTVEAMVLDVDQENRRISLGLKQIEPNPWELISQKYEVGVTVTGRVRNLTDFGAFVEIEEGIDGLVHISDLSWTKRIKHPSEILKKGETIDVKILNIDVKNQRLSLGVKQLLPDVWEAFFKAHKVGDVVTGKVVRVADFGVFVELEGGIEGFIHVSELDESRIEDPRESFGEGQEYPMKIIKMEIPDRKIGLSIKEALTDQRQQTVKEYTASSSSYRTTGMTKIGELMEEKGLAQDLGVGTAISKEPDEEKEPPPAQEDEGEKQDEEKPEE
ncbi:30S ribosomal protein S1 [Acidobacteriota bacterium]